MSEITKTEDQNSRSTIFWAVFAAIVVVCYLTGLGIPLLGPDEPRYSQVAREMFERGDWITPTLGGFDWFEKPALLYWLQIASYNFFGVSEFAARFGSALLGIGTVVCLWILGRASAKDGESSGFANWLALVAASSFGLIVFSRGASFDIILTFPITAALTAYFVADRSGRNAYAALFAAYFFVGVAFLAKGLIGIVFPFAIVGFYHVISWRMPSRAVIFSIFWGTLISLAVAALWYAPMYHVNGWKFIDEFFIQHHFQRYTSNKYLHPQPFHFFFWVLPLMTLPWLPFLFATLWKMIRKAFSKPKPAASPKDEFTFSPVILFGFAWMAVPLVFFSASGSKLPGYILPALPGAIILTATGLAAFVAKSVGRQRIVKAIAILTIVGAALLARFFVTDFLHEETVKHMFGIAADRGLTTEKVLMLHTISHSAEFYAPGRLVREADGKQKRLYGISQVISEMQAANSRQTLVIVPIEYVSQLTKSELFVSEILDNNGEIALVFVSLK